MTSRSISEGSSSQDLLDPGLKSLGEEAIDDIARFIVRFGLTVPAILSLETMQPMSFLGSQFMHVLSPSIGVFLSPSKWDALARTLEERDGLNRLITRIEELDQERQR